MFSPRPGLDYPESWRELLAWFPDDAACLAYLERLRWPEGFVCPVCRERTGWRMGDGLVRCAACDRRSSATAGTIFAGTRSPLTLWFAAAWYITNQKSGVSALGLQRALALGSYKTAWAWLHKFRRAMVRPSRDRLSLRERELLHRDTAPLEALGEVNRLIGVEAHLCSVATRALCNIMQHD